MKKLLIISLLLSLFNTVYSQKCPIRYGSVSIDELKQEVYAIDSSAPAIILCDYGEYADDKFTTYRNLRIKILRKEGLEYANHNFRGEKNINVRGITYNLENGKVVETKLKSESIKTTLLYDDVYLTKIAMPNVKVGSIIDLEIEYYLIPDNWDFQWEIPVLHSELFIADTRYFSYKKQFFGFQPLTYAGSNHWTAKNMPAFRSESFLTSSKNYRTRLEFDITDIHIPGYYYKSYSSSWEAIRDRLYESDYFGSVLNGGGYLSQTANEIKAKSSSKEDMIKNACEYVKQLKWNEENRVFTSSTSTKSCFKDNSGNVADINFTLIQLLRQLDFKAYPVVLSTRKNGKIIVYNPSLSKLNYVIAAVFTETDTLLLDATEKYLPYNLLPFRTLNGEGMLLDKKLVMPVDINANGKKDSSITMFTMELDNENTLKGKVSKSYSEYAAFDFRTDYYEFTNDDEYLTDFTSDIPGLKVSSHTVSNLDSIYLPVKEEFEIEISNGLEQVGDDYMLLPLLFESIKENPLKAPERKYPIDFGYLMEKQIIANYTIPEGMVVSSIPKTISTRLPDNSASFVYKIALDGNRIQVIYKFNINKSLFLENEYADLKAFYNQVVNKLTEPIMIKKI